MSKLTFKKSDSSEKMPNPESEGRIKVIIADDEEEVHAVTRFALKDFRYQGKGIEFLSAYSGAEAKQLLQAHPDASLILLDIVMEQDTSGLEVAEFIRKDLDNELIRIIVRTGQPGTVPEEEVITKYDVNDYKEKTELTSKKFKSSMTMALRSHADLFTVKSFRTLLEHEVRGRTAELQESNAKLSERTAELARAKDEAEAASRFKSGFLANMSHEIRTPMNTIIGMTQLALKSERNQKQRDYLNKISLSGEHLLGVIDDILDFSKIEAGKLILEDTHFDIDNVRQTLTNLVVWKATEKNLEITFDFDPDIPRNLCGDTLRLNQILINYINNAIKFTPHGEIIIRVRKLMEQESSTLLRFEVQDTGIGITESQKKELFQPFQQADSSTSRNYGGSGLGLVISKRLAELFGGEVGVESELDKGSTFWFTAWLVKGISSPPPVNNQGEQALETRKNRDMAALEGVRILLAEDHPFNQQVVIELLENTGAIVCTANNGKEALDLLRQEQFDCVLMDAQMPVMDGLQATRFMRADAILARIPVIALTASASDEERERCLAVGMNDFVSKPFKPDSLYAAIAKWVPSGNQS